MLKYYAAVGTLALSTTAVDAGGWETGRLIQGSYIRMEPT